MAPEPSVAITVPTIRRNTSLPLSITGPPFRNKDKKKAPHVFGHYTRDVKAGPFGRGSDRFVAALNWLKLWSSQRADRFSKEM
jgi:hypothetical protein